MTMISDLPNDLEAEILSRVPAKSLSRLKTTCKRWYALFREPKFVVKNKNLGRAVKESILLTNHGDVCLVAGDLHDTVVNTPIEVSDFDFAETFHCDGLMLCSALGNDRLVVWNPCTGQTRNIKARTSFHTNQTYALGYSTSSSSGHSYKILRCFDYRNDQEVWVPQCEIYELSLILGGFLIPSLLTTSCFAMAYL
uniref:F-box domain-containing protein n=1 Tax=Brassica oleracea var. oleracea TaxID=109376 RepID=A0A0D3EDL7_BRAOL